MEQTLLYILVFIFGYVTCKTFYFLRASRISLSLIKLSHIIFLSTILKVSENYVLLRERARLLKKQGHIDSKIYDTVSENINSQIEQLKDNSVEYLINMHPKFYRDALRFDDWVSSMKYLKENEETVFEFWKKYDR